MDGDEDDVVVPVHEFHDLMDPTLVVGHFHQTAEDAHAMVDMDDVITQIEGTEIVQRQLLRFFHRPSQADAVEAVKDFMVGIAADPVLVIDKSRMDVLSLDELRQECVLVLEHDGTETFQLGFLLTVDIDLVVVFQFGPDI